MIKICIALIQRGPPAFEAFILFSSIRQHQISDFENLSSLLFQESAIQNGGQSGKSKKKFGLKWFFSAPFKTGKEKKPDMVDVTDSILESSSDLLSSKGLGEDDPRRDSPAQQTSQAPLALTNAPRESSGLL